MIYVKKIRRIETNNMYKIKIDTTWTNQYYTSVWKGDRWVKNEYKEHIHVEVNSNLGDDQVYRLAKPYSLGKT